MRKMRQMRRFRRNLGWHLFCWRGGREKQIWGGVFGQKRLMEAHFAHDLSLRPHAQTLPTGERGDFMRIMRVDEEGLFIGKHLPCGKGERAAQPKHEAGMRLVGALPHVFQASLGG